MAKNDEKWDFSDYAFTITGIIVFVLLVIPEILYSAFGISILGGSLSETASSIVDDLEYGSGLSGTLTLTRLRALSPLLFLLTITICYFQEAIEAYKTGGYTGAIFTHTFESLLEESVYMAITTIMVYGAVLFGMMYISWLAGPISWILFVFIFPLVKRKGETNDEEKSWLLLFIFAAGIIVEAILGTWLAFPLAWLIICAVKFVQTVRGGIRTIDMVFDVLYYAFSVILMAIGILLNSWIASWTALQIALLICWLLSKTERFKKVPHLGGPPHGSD